MAVTSTSSCSFESGIRRFASKGADMLLLLALLLAASPRDLRAQGEAGGRAIHADALSSHIRFLADDLLPT